MYVCIFVCMKKIDAFMNKYIEKYIRTNVGIQGNMLNCRTSKIYNKIRDLKLT